MKLWHLLIGGGLIFMAGGSFSLIVLNLGTPAFIVFALGGWILYFGMRLKPPSSRRTNAGTTQGERATTHAGVVVIDDHIFLVHVEETESEVWVTLRIDFADKEDGSHYRFDHNYVGVQLKDTPVVVGELMIKLGGDLAEESFNFPSEDQRLPPDLVNRALEALGPELIRLSSLMRRPLLARQD